jgi:glycosyltransferase involved in cell wall biosynthesis
MKIGFDISQTGREKAGCGFFAESLIRHLAEIDLENEYTLYPTFGDHYWDPHWARSTCRIDQPNFKRAPGRKTREAARDFWSNPPDSLEEHLGSPDIVHSNNFFCPTGLRKARLVYTLHDLSFLVHPEWTTEENRIACFEGVFNASIFADFIIANSDYTRHHFLETLPHYPADRIRTIYEASRFKLSTDVPKPKTISFLLRDEFWLSVGILEPRKNHKGLLAAYASLKREAGNRFPLVLAGGKGWLMDDFKRQIESLGLQQEVILPGYLDDKDLQWLYQNCFAFVYPSYFEGFGLPVIEAMSLGAPVIVSNVTSLPEIVREAGILIDPWNQDAIFGAMQRLISGPDLRGALKEKALARASQFSWHAAASCVKDLYAEILSHPKGSLHDPFHESETRQAKWTMGVLPREPS